MKPVHQTVLPEEGNPYKGNCFAACLASLLELPIDKVPHVMERENWRELTNEWLSEIGLGTVEINIETEEPHLYALQPGMFLIVTGTTCRHSDRLHSVVARTLGGGNQWEYLHDPYPTGNFLVKATHLMWIVPLDPAVLL